MTNTAMTTSTQPTIIFAGGGSGGHLFPAIAVAQRVVERAPDASILFLCSDRRIDATVLDQAPWPFVALPAQPPAVRPLPRAPLRFISSWFKTRRLVRAELARRRVDPTHSVVVTMGGYVAAPVAIQARSLRIPTLLCNLDVVAGKANRFIARKVSCVVSAVHCTDLDRYNPAIVGMPIRTEAINTRSAGECRRSLQMNPELNTLLITGASQGASTLNHLMIDLVARHASAFNAWQVLHLAGDREEQSALEQAYRAHNIPARVLSFCHDMASAWGASSLALSRCGASSVAEAIANAVPTIFCPYPWHKDRHQAKNARPYVDDGLAWLADDAIDPAQNLVTIGTKLLACMENDAQRLEVRRRLSEQAPADPAAVIADLALGLAGIQPPDPGQPRAGTNCKKPPPDATTG